MRELAKKQKKEDKLKRRQENKSKAEEGGESPDESTPSPADTPEE
jgi:hypothetical protein